MPRSRPAGPRRFRRRRPSGPAASRTRAASPASPASGEECLPIACVPLDPNSSLLEHPSAGPISQASTVVRCGVPGHRISPVVAVCPRAGLESGGRGRASAAWTGPPSSAGERRVREPDPRHTASLRESNPCQDRLHRLCVLIGRAASIRPWAHRARAAAGLAAEQRKRSTESVCAPWLPNRRSRSAAAPCGSKVAFNRCVPPASWTGTNDHI